MCSDLAERITRLQTENDDARSLNVGVRPSSALQQAPWWVKIPKQYAFLNVPDGVNDDQRNKDLARMGLQSLPRQPNTLGIRTPSPDNPSRKRKSKHTDREDTKRPRRDPYISHEWREPTFDEPRDYFNDWQQPPPLPPPWGREPPPPPRYERPYEHPRPSASMPSLLQAVEQEMWTQEQQVYVPQYMESRPTYSWPEIVPGPLPELFPPRVAAWARSLPPPPPQLPQLLPRIQNVEHTLPSMQTIPTTPLAPAPHMESTVSSSTEKGGVSEVPYFDPEPTHHSVPIPRNEPLNSFESPPIPREPESQQNIQQNYQRAEPSGPKPIAPRPISAPPPPQQPEPPKPTPIQPSPAQKGRPRSNSPDTTRQKKPLALLPKRYSNPLSPPSNPSSAAVTPAATPATPAGPVTPLGTMGRFMSDMPRYAPMPSAPKIAISRHPSQIVHEHVPLRIAPAPAKRVDGGGYRWDEGGKGHSRREYSGMGMFKPAAEKKKDENEGHGEERAKKDGESGKVEKVVEKEMGGKKEVATEVAKDVGTDENEEEEGNDGGMGARRRKLRSSIGRRKH
jgi:hypothetical protein